MLAFAEVRRGQRIADVGPGGGYFTRLFSAAVGDGGKVYAIIRPVPPDAQRQPAIIAVAAEPGYGNIVVSPQDLANWSLPEPLDTVWISQEYHDFHLTRAHLDVAAVNGAMFNAVKPGGLLVIIDHAAVDGSDLTVPDALHRIDQATLRREVEAAGWVFEAESQVLRNPGDPRTASVFDPSIRGHTDQFVMRFRKPR
jgi:predicted methyltransferase